MESTSTWGRFSGRAAMPVESSTGPMAPDRLVVG